MKGCRWRIILACAMAQVLAMENKVELDIYADATWPHTYIVKIHDSSHGTKAIFPGGTVTLRSHAQETIQLDIAWRHMSGREEIIEFWELSLHDCATAQKSQLSITALTALSQHLITQLLRDGKLSAEQLYDTQFSPRICLPPEQLINLPLKAASVQRILVPLTDSPTCAERAERARALATWGVSFNPFKQ